MGEYYRNASEDAFVHSLTPDTNLNSEGYLLITNSDTLSGFSFIKFSMADIPQYGGSVYLRLYFEGYRLSNGSSFEGRVWYCASNWSEDTITWNNIPEISDTSVQLYSDTSHLNQYITVDVSTLVAEAVDNNDTDITFKIQYWGWFSDFADNIRFSDSESANPPQLEFTGVGVTGQSYERESGHTVSTVNIKAFAIVGADITPPSPQTGDTVIWATDDVYSDVNAQAIGANEPRLFMHSGLGNTQVIYLKFPISTVGRIIQAKLRMYCLDFCTDGTYLPVKLTQLLPAWSEPDNCSYSRMIGGYVESCYNNIYACPEMTIGTFEIDVTRFVNTARHLRGIGETDYLSLKIECYQTPFNRELYATFVSIQSGFQFIPHLVITPEPTELEIVTKTASQDCYTSEARHHQTHGSILPPELPCINHGFESYPVNSGGNEVFWAFFPLTNLRGARSVTLNFWITADSNFTDDVETYFLAIGGQTYHFDQETFDYDYIHNNYSDEFEQETAGAYYVVCPLVVAEYTGQTKLVTIDITKIYRHSMTNLGLLISIGGMQNATDTIYIGGLQGSLPAYLSITLDPEYPHPDELQDLMGSDGRVILYPQLDAEQQLPENGDGYRYFHPYEYAHARNEILYFSFQGIPSEVFSKLDMAVLRIPFFGWDKYQSEGGADDLYLINYSGVDNYHWYFEIVKLTGENTEDHIWWLDYPYYRPNIILNTDDGSYIDIDIRDMLWDSKIYSLLNDPAHPDYLFSLWLVTPFVYTSDVLGDGLRFGSIAGDFPPYIELRWDDYGIDYYVNGRSGLDTNNGMSPTTQWRTWDHAAKNTPEMHVLFATEDFHTEPPNNQGGFTNDQVWVYNLPQYYYGYTHSDVEVNTGDPMYPTSMEGDIQYPDGTYGIEYNDPPAGDATYSYARMTFDISSLDSKIFRAVLFWFVPYASEAGSYNNYEHMYSTVALMDGDTIIDSYSHQSLGWAYHMPNPQNPIPALDNYWWKMDVTDFVNDAIEQGITNPTFRIGLDSYGLIYEAYHEYRVSGLTAGDLKPVLLVHQDINYIPASRDMTAETSMNVGKLYVMTVQEGTIGSTTTQDTFIGTSESTTPQGAQEFIQISNYRRGFIKFDISNRNTASSVILHLIGLEKTYPDEISGTSLPLYHYIRWYTNNWDEDTLTYSNDSTSVAGGIGVSVRVPTPIPDEITVDVTALYNAAITAGYTELTLRIQQNAPCWSNDNYYVKYGSKEGGKAPYLVIT